MNIHAVNNMNVHMNVIRNMRPFSLVVKHLICSITPHHLYSRDILGNGLLWQNGASHLEKNMQLTARPRGVTTVVMDQLLVHWMH